MEIAKVKKIAAHLIFMFPSGRLREAARQF
jgi:hypothetical protein